MSTTEYKLSYTAAEINNKLAKVDENATSISQLSGEIFEQVVGGYQRTSANINNCLYEYGYLENDGSDVTYDIRTDAFINIDYLPVEGGKSICWVGENVDDNGNIINALQVWQFDANFNCIVQRVPLNRTTSLTDLKLLNLNPNTAYIRFSAWFVYADFSPLKIAFYYSDNAKSTFEEYAEEPYYVNAIDYNNVKDQYGNSITDSIAHVTAEMFGALGDGRSDDTEALKNCIAFAKRYNVPIKCENIYKTSETLVVDFDYFDIEIRQIVYSGSECAVKFDSCAHGNAKIRNIQAQNGSGVLLSGTTQIFQYNKFEFGLITAKNHCVYLYGKNGVQYNKIVFERFVAKTSCIEFEVLSSGWISENTWQGGRLEAYYGIKANGIITGGVHNLGTQKFYNIGFEGVTIGCYLNTVHGFIFNNPRTYEGIVDKVFVLVGDVMACHFYLCWFRMEWFDFSQIGDDHRISNNFYGYFFNNYGEPYEFTSFSITSNGVMKNVNQKVYGYLNFYKGSTDKTLTLNPEQYLTYFPAGISCDLGCGEITLDSKYYNAYNVNTLYVDIAETMDTTDLIKDSDGNLVVNLSLYPNKKLRLTKMHSVIGDEGSQQIYPNDWLIEVLN